MQTKIKIPVEVSLSIEKAQYEYNSTRDVVAYMLGSGYNTDTDSFRSYEDKNLKAYIAYNELKDTMQKTYLESAINGKLLNWSLDFDTSEVTVDYA